MNEISDERKAEVTANISTLVNKLKIPCLGYTFPTVAAAASELIVRAAMQDDPIKIPLYIEAVNNIATLIEKLDKERTDAH